MTKRFCTFAVAAVSAALVSFAASASPVTSPANMRSGPGPKWPVIVQIPAGADVDVVNCGPGWKHDWCHVKFQGNDGFVAAYTLAPAGNNVVVAPVVTTDLANVRKGPGTHWPVIGVLQPGTVVNVSSCSRGWLFGWCRIHYEGNYGFVNSVLLKRQGALFAR
jgi:uncharacterized protein YraI